MNFFEGVAETSGSETLFRGEHFRLPLTRARLGALPAAGERIVAGFRPEDIVPEGHGMAPRNGLAFRSRIEFTEMLGNETLLFSSIGGDEFISRMHQPRPVEPDESLAFRLNLERMHLFDAETGQSIRGPATQS